MDGCLVSSSASEGSALHQESSSPPTHLQPALRQAYNMNPRCQAFFDPRDNMRQMDKQRQGFLLYSKQAGTLGLFIILLFTVAGETGGLEEAVLRLPP